MKQARLVFNLLALGGLLLLLSGCAALLRPQLDSGVNYERDIRFEVMYSQGDKWSKPLTITGMGVMPAAPWYKIKVFPPGKADMLTITSCHREQKTPNPDKAWYSSGYEFTFNLVESIETKKACPFDIGVYEREAGRHGWGMLAIASDREKLPALTKCNGRIKAYGGVSVCQAKEGLLQEYVFDRPVAIATVSGCEIKKPEDKKVWQFLMPPGTCTIYFIDEKDPDNFHMAHFFGYSVVPIRGIQ